MNTNPNEKQADQVSDTEIDDRRSASWDLRHAVRNYSTLVISHIAVALFSFASVSLIIKYLGTSGNGQIVAIIAGSQILQVFVNWTCVALARHGVEEFIDTGKISKSFWSRTLILLPNLLILIISLPLWFPLLSRSLKLSNDLAGVLIANIAAIAFWLHVQHAMQGVKRPRTQAIMLAIERVGIFGGLLALLWFGSLTAYTAIWAYTISPFVLGVIGLWRLRKFISLRFEFDATLFKRILRFSLPLIPFAIVGYLSTGYFDAIFITQFLSKADLGMYSVVYQLNGIMMQFPSLGGILLMPLFVTLQSKSKNENVDTYLRDVLPLLTICWSFGCVLVALSAGFALPLFFGPEFARATEYLLVLAAAATFAMPVLIGYSPYTNAVSATYISLIAAVAAAIANVTLNLILIPRIGLLGSAWATAIAFLASFTAMTAVTHVKFDLKYSWSAQALLPVLASAVTVSLTKSVWLALAALALTTFVLIVMQYKAVAHSIRVTLGFTTTIQDLKQ